MDFITKIISKCFSKIYMHSSIHPHHKLKRTPSYEDTTKFITPISNGVVVKVYDGDSFILAAKLPYDSSPLFRFSVRMRGVISPEITSVNPKFREQAKISRDALSRLIFNKNVTLANIKIDRFGNIISNVYLDGVDVSQWMILNEFSVDRNSTSKKFESMYH